MVEIRVVSRNLWSLEELGFGKVPSTWGVPWWYAGHTDSKPGTQGVGKNTRSVSVNVGRGARPRMLVV